MHVVVCFRIIIIIVRLLSSLSQCIIMLICVQSVSSFIFCRNNLYFFKLTAYASNVVHNLLLLLMYVYACL